MAAPQTGTPTANSTWRLDVDLDIAGFTGSWKQVLGISNFQPGKNDTVTDTTDYDTDGWGSDAVMQQKWVNTLTLDRKDYVASGGRDPGQEALLAAADGLYMIRARWYERKPGGRAYEGYALVQWADPGGEAAGQEQANVTLLGQSKREKITNPYTETVTPVVNSVTPATGAAAGGDLVTIAGSGFTGATGVTFDGVAAADFTVVSAMSIAAVTPAGVAGPAPVVVTTPAGTSGATGDEVFEYV